MIHRGEMLKHIGHPGPYCNHRPRTFPAVRGSLFLALAYSVLFTSSPINAEVGELKVQDPWAYTYRFDQEDNIEFMAITPAAEDGKIWLVLACKDTQPINLSMINSEGFSYPLTEKGELIVQLDGSAAIYLPTIVVQQKQIRADPGATKQLIPVLMRSNQLLVSTSDMNGEMHMYSFSLQPNNRALRDIDIHCALE